MIIQDLKQWLDTGHAKSGNMKRIRLKKIIKQVLNEQFTDKDIVGACQNKELFELSQTTMQMIIGDWVAWTTSLENVPDNPTFTISDPEATSYLAISYMAGAGEGNFNDFYFSVVNSIPSDLGPDVSNFPSPMCPYGYVSTMNLGITVNQENFNFSFFNFGDLVGQIQSTTWGPTLFGQESVGGFDGITDFNSFISALNALNQQSDSINISLNFPPITVNMCNCVWTEVIEGCMDDTMCNYDSLAGSDDGSCEPPNQCGSCTGDLSCIGCIDYNACNYDSTVTFVDNDLCDYTSCVGCMDENACNYDSSATMSGDCDFESCAGCTDDTACNYDPNATINQGCDYESCAGCMDPDALNYDPDATIQPSGSSASGICQYEGEITEPDTDPIRDKIPNKKPRPDKPASSDGISGRPERPITLGGDENLTGGPVQYGITACNPNSAFFNCQICCYEISATDSTFYSEECGCSGIDYPVEENIKNRFKKLAGIKKKK